jgi:predicted DNA-binding transcriptional regulator YafY
VVLHGNQGGIELDFNYRTRLTGLSSDEARALAIILSKPTPELDAIGIGKAGEVARQKLIESLPDRSRNILQAMQNEVRFEAYQSSEPDPRIAAISGAIKRKNIIRINARSANPRIIHPTALISREDGWSVIDNLTHHRRIGFRGPDFLQQSFLAPHLLLQRKLLPQQRLCQS